MINTRFEKSKVQRLLNANGKTVSVFRREINEFNELSSEEKLISEFVGVYHERSSYSEMRVTDGARFVKNKEPMILTLIENISSESFILKPTDTISIDGVKYEVSTIIDVQNWGIIADICMNKLNHG